MAETRRPKGLAARRGYAMLIQAGDTEISGALAQGIMAARMPAEAGDAQIAPTTGNGESKLANAAIGVKVAIGRGLSSEDYAGMIFDAEMEYGESLYEPGPMGKVGEALMVGYALLMMAFERLFAELGMRNDEM